MYKTVKNIKVFLKIEHDICIQKHFINYKNTQQEDFDQMGISRNYLSIETAGVVVTFDRSNSAFVETGDPT